MCQIDQPLLDKITLELNAMLKRKKSVRGHELHTIAKQLGYEWRQKGGGSSHTTYIYPDDSWRTSFTLSGSAKQEIEFYQVEGAVGAMLYAVFHHEDMLKEARSRAYA